MKNTQKEKTLIIFSGGLDSTVSLYLAKEHYEIILALCFDYGQKAAQHEKQAAEAIARRNELPVQFLSLDWVSALSRSALTEQSQAIPNLDPQKLDHLQTISQSAKAVWVPNRNGLLINLAAVYAESLDASVILAGFNREEATTFPDNSAEFTQAMNQSLFYSTQNHVRVEAPTQQFSKTEMIREGKRLSVPFDLIWSCYHGQERMCGLCESCQRLKRAFRENNLMEEYQYRFDQ